jgi:hypothetical protein
MRYTPWVVSEHVPDFSTLENIARGPRFAGLRDEALAVALWGLVVDRNLGIFHYCPAQEPHWGKDAHDPLLVFNVYGFTICHVHAHVLAMLARAAGMPARVANIRGHEGTEIFYAGAWHYFDADVQYFHRLRTPPHEIASREDLFHDPSLVDDQPRPSNPYGLPDRLPEGFRKLYASPSEYPELHEEKIHSMDFVLRPGEEMTRYFHHRGRWHVFENYPAMFAQYRDETGPEGPTERFWPRRQWGNGFFKYAPRLHSDFRDAELGADSIVNLALDARGLTCSGGGHALFSFPSPYLYCGVPDPMRRAPSVDGARISAAFDIPPGGSARLEASTGEAFAPWRPLWSSDGRTGEVKAQVDFTEMIDGRFNPRLCFHLEGKGTTLAGFETRMWFMVSPHSLPALRVPGENRMEVRSGDRYGLATREFRVERRFDAPGAMEHVYDGAENLRHDPASASPLLPVDPSRPWSLGYELVAPRHGKIVWLSAYALFESRSPAEPEEPFPATIEMADSPDGPWRPLAQRKLAEHPLGWHFGLFGEGRFSGVRESGFVRFRSRKGMKGFRVAAHYLPAEAPPPGAPLEVEHAWYEDDPLVGRRLRSHLERVPGPTHAYVVRCGGIPHDERIVLRVPSFPR